MASEKMLGNFDVQDSIADDDLVLGYDSSEKKVRNFKFGTGIWSFTENKLINSAISKLNTTNKTIVGAINELANQSGSSGGTGTGTVDTSKTFMTGLHVYSTEVLADLDNMADNRAYLISCHGVKNVPVDTGGMACSIGFSGKYVVHIYTCLEDNRTFIRTKNGTVFGSWKELQNNESSNVATIESPYKGKTIVAFGDSIVAGWGWKEGTGIIQPLKEKYSDATWINKAESGANFAVTSKPGHTPIVTQIRSYTGVADAIIFNGGVNDTNNSISVGSIESGYDASYKTGTFCGALESALQYIMDTYPLAVKLYIIPHSFAKDNSYVNSIYSKAIEICEKWNMPYLDMRKCSQIAMTSKNKSKYTRNPNSGVGDGVHPVESWYRTFYCPIIDQKLRNLGIGYATTSAEQPVNPSESHTELESLSVDGNCYFDTEILPDQNTNTEAKLYIKSGTMYICGARDDNYKYGYTITDNFYAIRGTVSSAAKNTAFWEDNWVIKQNGATATFGNNSVTLDNAGNFALTSPFYIGCMSKNGGTAGAGLKGKIYYAKIYSGSNLVADMIPVKKSDVTLCLYDKVRKKYIYNSGSGTVK